MFKENLGRRPRNIKNVSRNREFSEYLVKIHTKWRRRSGMRTGSNRVLTNFL